MDRQIPRNLMASLVKTFLPAPGANALPQHRIKTQPVLADSFGRTTAQAEQCMPFFFCFVFAFYGVWEEMTAFIILFNIKKKTEEKCQL